MYRIKDTNFTFLCQTVKKNILKELLYKLLNACDFLKLLAHI